MTELDNARRTILKAEEVLRRCESYFRHQAEMNAAAHLAERVMLPPIHGAIDSTLHGITMFLDSHPEGANLDAEKISAGVLSADQIRGLKR